MKTLSSLDRYLQNIIKYVAGAMLVTLTFIVFIQVIMRYVFQSSIGGFEELPVYIMIVSVWLMAAVLGREDDHIKLEIITLLIKKESVRKVIKIVLNILSFVSLAIFTYLSFEYLQFGIRTGDTSSGLQFPIWWLTVFVLISSILLTLYYLKFSFKEIKEIKKWK